MGRKARVDGCPERLVKRGLVSLAVAARMVHRRAYPQQYAIAEPQLSPAQLDALAHVIAAMAPIFTVNYRSASVRELAEGETAGGAFKDGARELAFDDGRAPIRWLAARIDSTSDVARKLREITSERVGAAAEPTQTGRYPPTPTR